MNRRIFQSYSNAALAVVMTVLVDGKQETEPD